MEIDGHISPIGMDYADNITNKGQQRLSILTRHVACEIDSDNLDFDFAIVYSEYGRRGCQVWVGAARRHCRPFTGNGKRDTRLSS